MDAFWPTFQRRNQAPPDYIGDTATKQSVRMAQPQRVVLPLQDVPENPFEVFVNTGDTVTAGQKVGTIGKAPEHIAVHSPIAGEVTAIIPMPHPLVHEVNSVRISADGTESQAPMQPFRDSGLSDVGEFFREKGIPLDYKYFATIATILVNATEFEPYLCSKERLILEETEKFSQGLTILLENSGADKLIIVVEKGKSSLVSVVRSLCNRIPAAVIEEVNQPLPDTIEAMIRQKALMRGIVKDKVTAIDRTIVIEPYIAVAVYDAFVLGIPFMEQLVTVAGSGIQTLQNMWIKIGTQLSDIIQQAGGNVSNVRRVTLGGPIMGRPQPMLDAPLIKKARGVFAAVALAFDEERKSRFYKRCACVRCGKCVDVCPARIPPNLIADLVEHKRFGEAEELGLYSCLECGLCYYVCPSIIPLVELLKLGKLNSKGRDSLLIFNSYRTLWT